METSGVDQAWVPRLAASASEAGALKALREALALAGYEPSVVDEARRLGRFLPPEDVHETFRADYPSDTLELLLSLFALGAPVPRADAQRVLVPDTLEELQGLGLLGSHDARVWSRVCAVPYEHLLLLGDPGEWDRPDVVSPLYGLSSKLLAWLTPRAPRRSAADLGTGAGVQALLASQHCERVVGTDVNPRALAFAALGAQVNGVENVDWREGSWLEPIAGERFDLIVGNLPYVVSPDIEFTFRDAGLPGGELIARICAELPNHLEEDGLAILTHEWPQRTEEDWRLFSDGRLRAPGCDTLLVSHATADLLDHAVAWHRPPVRWLARSELERGVARWHAYSRSSGTTSIGFGALVLRRRAGGSSWMIEAREGARHGEKAARQLERLIAGNDLISGGGDILAQRLRVPDGFSVSQRFVRREHQWATRVAMASVPGELGIAAAIDPDALDVVFRCDGRAALASLVESEGEHRAVVVEALRELLAHGLLELC